MRCGTGTCVRFDEDQAGGGFVASSTIEGNDGKVFWTYAEVVQFFEQAERGHFGQVLTRAREAALVTAGAPAAQREPISITA